MPKKQTRLNLDSSGKQIPPKKKSKPSPTYIMEKVGWQKERDPFSSCSFKESARRAELASKKKSFQYSSILKERSYSVRIGEVIEGYKVLSRKGDTFVISKGSNLFRLPLSYRKKKS